VIRVRKLSKRHGATEVLREVSADVERGETVAIVGPSGGGKSTLLRCLNYLEPFDTGEIEIARVRLFAANRDARQLRDLRTRVGMVFQQFNLFPHLTALDNITLAPRIVRKAERAAAERRGRELLARVGLGERAGAGSGPRGAAVRRADVGARPRDARRSDDRDPRSRGDRHHDAGRHPRDAVRERHREPRLGDRSRHDRRGRHAGDRDRRAQDGRRAGVFSAATALSRLGRQLVYRRDQALPRKSATR
jgi:hypothetical protein